MSELQRPSPPVDDWELEPSEIAFQEKIASGAFGDLYKGAYCGQDVAIKIVRNVQDNTQQFQEFVQVLHQCFHLIPRLHHELVCRDSILKALGLITLQLVTPAAFVHSAAWCCRSIRQHDVVICRVCDAVELSTQIDLRLYLVCWHKRMQ